MLYPNNVEKEENVVSEKETKEKIKEIFKYLIFDRNNFAKRVMAKFNI